jgi:hypothetical protein
MQVSYLKYNNGRFFANGEYTFQYIEGRRNGSRPLSGWTNAWHAEIGSVVGPTKFTLAHFYSSGNDRRQGYLGAYDQYTNFISFGSRENAIGPYQYLIGLYGSGNNAYDALGECRFHDFLAYAARLDYAVAANLNIFGSVMYAQRASNTATPVAYYNGASSGSLATFTGLRTPNVPDDYLGWEFDVGVDWKLLEGMTFKSLFGYWQPGDWFKYAYVDYSPTPAGAVPNTLMGGDNTAGYQISPNRDIDPIIGFKGSMVMEF